MLLKFTASNYKSFKDEFVFSLIPAPKQKGLQCYGRSDRENKL